MTFVGGITPSPLPTGPRSGEMASGAVARQRRKSLKDHSSSTASSFLSCRSSYLPLYRRASCHG